MRSRRLDLLQEMPLFGGIRKEMLAFLLEHAPVVTHGTGEVFFREGDSANSMYVLEKGRVAVVKIWRGVEYLLSHLDTGDCFGEIALVDLGTRSATVLAVQPCRAVEISSDSLYLLYQKDLEQFTLIQMNLARELGRRLRKADLRLFQERQALTIVQGEYRFRSV